MTADTPGAIDESVALAAQSTAPRMLALRARQTPHAIALREIRPDGSLVDWNWQSLHTEVTRFADGLRRCGIKGRARVGILSDPGVKAIVAFIGAQAAGCIPFGLHPTHDVQTWRDIMAETLPSALVLHRRADLAALANDERGLPPTVRLVVHVDPPDQARATATAVATCEWASMVGEGEGEPSAVDERHPDSLAPDDICAFYFTSGSTGRPKGVPLSWKGLILSLCGFFAPGHVQPTPTAVDRTLHEIAMASHAGLWFGIAYPLVFGCTAYVPGRGTDPAVARRVAQPTLYYGRPAVWADAAHRVNAKLADQGAAATSVASLLHDEGFGSLRHVFCGGAPIPPAVVDTWFGWGVTIRTFYGMTECSGVATMVGGDTPRAGTVGRASPTAEVRLDEDGEILIGGPIVFQGYLNRPGETARALDDAGFFHTGDLGRFDSAGNLVMLDRKSNLLQLSTGERILPSQAEMLLGRHPSIAFSLLVGENRPSAGMLVEIRPDEVRRALPPALAARLPSYEELAAHPAVRALVAAEIADVNRELAGQGLCTVTSFRLIPQALDPNDREIRTATGKIRRGNVQKRYAGLIDAMYAIDPAPATEQPIEIGHGK